MGLANRLQRRAVAAGNPVANRGLLARGAPFPGFAVRIIPPPIYITHVLIIPSLIIRRPS